MLPSIISKSHVCHTITCELLRFNEFERESELTRTGDRHLCGSYSYRSPPFGLARRRSLTLDAVALATARVRKRLRSPPLTASPARVHRLSRSRSSPLTAAPARVHLRCFVLIFFSAELLFFSQFCSARSLFSRI